MDIITIIMIAMNEKVSLIIIRKPLSILCTLIFLCCVGLNLLVGWESSTLGSFIRSMLPSFAFGLVCYLIFYAWKKGINLFEGFPDVKQLFAVVFLVLPAGIAAFYLFSKTDIGSFLVGASLIVAFVASVLFNLKGRGDIAVSIFIFCVPFLVLMEDWYDLSFHLSVFLLSPTIIFLLSLFVTFDFRRLKLSKQVKLLFLIYLVFFLFALISAFFSINLRKSFAECILEYGYIALMLPLILASFKTRQQVISLMKTLVFTMCIFGFLALYFTSQKMGSLTLFNFGVDNVIKSSVATQFFILPVGIVLFFIARKYRFVLYLPLLFFSTLILLMSFWRAGVIALLISFWVLLFDKKTWKHLVGVFLGVSSVLFVFGNHIISSYLSLKNFDPSTFFSDASLILRFNAWRGALDMILDKPLLGIGSGMWQEHVASYVLSQPIVIPNGYFWGYIMDPHNQYLKVYLETGFVGFLLWIIFFGMLLREAIKLAMKMKGDREGFIASLAFIVFLLSFLIMAIFSGRFHVGSSITTGLIFMCVLGLFLAFRECWSDNVVKRLNPN